MGIYLGACHLLEQIGLIFLAAGQEFGKLALSEHHSAEELVHVQADNLMDTIINLAILSIVSRVDTLGCAQDAPWADDIAINFFVGAMHMPGSDIRDALVVVKGEADIGCQRATTQQLFGVSGIDWLLALAGLILVL